MAAAEQASDLGEEKPTRGCCAKSELQEARDNNIIVNARRGLCSCFPFTDIPILLVFIAFFVGMAYVFFEGVSNGNVNRLLYGTDFSGTACGDSASGTENYDNQYWPNPLYAYDTSGNPMMGSICLDACPTSVNSTSTSGTVDHDHIICTCNNDLTIGRGQTYMTSVYQSWGQFVDDDSVNNSLASGGDSLLALDCNGGSGCTTSQCSHHGPNWVRYENPTDEMKNANSNLSKTLYYHMPNAWISPYMGYSGTGYGQNIVNKYMIPNCMYAYETYEIMNRCLPRLDASLWDDFCGNSSSTSSLCPDISQYDSYMNSFAEVGGKALTDLQITYPIILGSFGFAILFGFLWLYFMEKCATCVVWTVIILAMIMTALVAAVCFWFGYDLQQRCDVTPQLVSYDTDLRNMYVSYVFGGIFAALWLVVTCVAVCACKQITEASRLTALASEAFLDFPYLLLYPAVQVMALFAVIALWSLGGALLASSGDQEISAVYGSASWAFNDTLQYMMWYWLFGGLWLVELVLACGFMIVAFCFSMWFFSTEVSEPPEEGSRGISCCGGTPPPVRAVPNCTLWKACKMTWFNHLGTVTFGALIMAIIDFIRIVVEYIEHKKEEYLGKDPNALGPCAKIVFQLWDYIFCCLRSCLWCLDKCMRFLNQNAYIQTCINGTDLCKSACAAVQAMLSHIVLFALLTTIQKGFFWFGKISISFATAGICGLLIEQLYADQISSIIIPVFVCLMVGYGISSAFMQVFDMGIDTMLGCYAEADQAAGAVALCCCCGSYDPRGDLQDHIPSKLVKHIDEKKETEEYITKQKLRDELRESENKKTDVPLSGTDTKNTE
jgi:hypothetical protein